LAWPFPPPQTKAVPPPAHEAITRRNFATDSLKQWIIYRVGFTNFGRSDIDCGDRRITRYIFRARFVDGGPIVELQKMAFGSECVVLPGGKPLSDTRTCIQHIDLLKNDGFIVSYQYEEVKARRFVKYHVSVRDGSDPTHQTLAMRRSRTHPYSRTRFHRSLRSFYKPDKARMYPPRPRPPQWIYSPMIHPPITCSSVYIQICVASINDDSPTTVTTLASLDRFHRIITIGRGEFGIPEAIEDSQCVAACHLTLALDADNHVQILDRSIFGTYVLRKKQLVRVLHNTSVMLNTRNVVLYLNDPAMMASGASAVHIYVKIVLVQKN